MSNTSEKTLRDTLQPPDGASNERSHADRLIAEEREALLKSHSDLCRAVRVAGRWIAQRAAGPRDYALLDRMRTALLGAGSFESRDRGDRQPGTRVEERENRAAVIMFPRSRKDRVD